MSVDETNAADPSAPTAPNGPDGPISGDSGVSGAVAVAPDDYTLRFGGIGRLYGNSGLARLRAARVMVVGIGGVGSWTAEGLARSGVGRIDLVDLDDVCVTNTNRQIHAMDGNVGRLKVEVMAERIQRINPDCDVRAIIDFFTPSTARELLSGRPDFVVDAIDAHRNKCLMATLCRELEIPLVMCGGAGGRRDGGRVKVVDLSRTGGDRLLHRVRKTLRQRHGFPRGKKKFGIPTVFSDEDPMFPTTDGEVCDVRQGDTSVALDCESGFGTASFVTGVFGLLASNVVVNAIAQPPTVDAG